MKQIIIFLLLLIAFTSCHKSAMQPQVKPYVAIFQDSSVTFTGTLSSQNLQLGTNPTMGNHTFIISNQFVSLDLIGASMIFLIDKVSGSGSFVVEYGYYDQGGTPHYLNSINVTVTGTTIVQL